jgi:glycine betaine/proline transport system ATP-binding protein
MNDKLVINSLRKIFGPDPDEAIRLLGQGLSKDEIFARTPTTVGVKDANFAIRDGKVFVVMGLSGSGKSTLLRMLNRLIDPTRGRVLPAHHPRGSENENRRATSQAWLLRAEYGRRLLGPRASLW